MTSPEEKPVLTKCLILERLIPCIFTRMEGKVTTVCASILSFLIPLISDLNAASSVYRSQKEVCREEESLNLGITAEFGSLKQETDGSSQ